MNESERELRRAAKLARRVERHFEEQRQRHERKERRKANRAQRANRKERPRARWDPRDVDVHDDEWPEPERRDRRRSERSRPACEPDRTGDRHPPLGTSGRIVGIARERCRVQTSAGERDVAIGRHLALRPAVGDRVEIVRDAIVTVHARTSWLARRDPHDPRRSRVLAANLDVAVIVVAAEPTGFKSRLVDRFVVVALAGHVEPLVVVNKVDQVTPVERAALEAELASHRSIGIATHTVSAVRGDGLEELRGALADRLCAFVGPSGVGKSSIVHALDPGQQRAIGAVRSDGRGRHTTTASVLLELAGGLCVVDTPGIRQLALFELTLDDVRAAFPDLDPARLGCRFRDCRHAHEPGCRAAAAVSAGDVRAARLDSFARIVASLTDG